MLALCFVFEMNGSLQRGIAAMVQWWLLASPSFKASVGGLMTIPPVHGGIGCDALLGGGSEGEVPISVYTQIFQAIPKAYQLCRHAAHTHAV